MVILILLNVTGWGPQDSLQLPYKWLYGRYNELVTGSCFMVYKPTYIWGPLLKFSWGDRELCFWEELHGHPEEYQKKAWPYRGVQ